MSKKILTALLLWVESRDLLSISFERAWEYFKRDAWEAYKLYCDPDSMYYKESIHPTEYIELFADTLLRYNNI